MTQKNKLKQSAHTLETDDLLKILEEQEVQSEGPIDYEHDVLNFISTFNIEPGQEKVKQHTLYLIYKVWSKNPLRKTEFHAKMAPFFEVGKVGNHGTFLINQNAIKLTHDAYKYFTNTNTRLHQKPWAKHFENFLKFHSLKRGNYYIDVRILYFIYDKYTHATGLDKHTNQHLSENNFGIYCKIYLPEKLTRYGKLYGISDNIQNFFQVGQLKRMQEEYEKEAKPQKRKRRTGFRSKAKPKKTG